MKKLLTTLLFTILFLTGKSQNLIGVSLRDCYKTLDEKGFILNKGYTEQNIFYLSASDNESVRLYYFTNNNICAYFAISYPGFTYTDIKAVLNKAGYWQTGDLFYTNDYKAKIVYLNDYSCFFILVELR